MRVKTSFFIVSAAVVSSFALVSAVDQECAGQPKCVGVGHDRVDQLTEDCHKFPTIVAYNKCCNDNCAKTGGKKEEKDDKKKKKSLPEANSHSNKNANRYLRELQA